VTSPASTVPEAQLPEEQLLGQFIPLHYHFNMLRDQSRMVPFREAIERVVPAGSTVLELGGGTGVLSWLAAQRARKVWCVERNPALARAARTFLSENPQGDRVQVVLADAMSWLPPEPVDVVICEMLHVALIREKQLEVLQSFKERYRAAFGPQLPKFIPETSLLGMQPIEQDFNFSGYTARVPLFEPPGLQMAERVLAEAEIYSTIDYAGEIRLEFAAEHCVRIQRAGTFNAISFLTNNFLAFLLTEGRAVQWFMNQLILPIPQPLAVAPGDTVAIRFAYRAGGPLEALQESLVVEPMTHVMLQPTGNGSRRVA